MIYVLVGVVVGRICYQLGFWKGYVKCWCDLGKPTFIPPPPCGNSVNPWGNIE